MIQNPKIKMKVNVMDPLCCNFGEENNHAGNGTIVRVSNHTNDSNLVKMDKYPDESWWRCHQCIEEI